MAAQAPGVVKTKIKKNDYVQVMAGKDRGKSGKVLRVVPRENKALVEKINMIKRHTRPSKVSQQGGILEKEALIHISNLMLLCAQCGKPVRVSWATMQDGKKVRVCKKCGEVFDK